MHHCSVQYILYNTILSILYCTILYVYIYIYSIVLYIARYIGPQIYVQCMCAVTKLIEIIIITCENIPNLHVDQTSKELIYIYISLWCLIYALAPCKYHFSTVSVWLYVCYIMYTRYNLYVIIYIMLIIIIIIITVSIDPVAGYHSHSYSSCIYLHTIWSHALTQNHTSTHWLTIHTDTVLQPAECIDTVAYIIKCNCKYFIDMFICTARRDMSNCSSSVNWATLRKTLDSYNQSHLLQWISELDKEQQHVLHKELTEIDFDRIERQVLLVYDTWFIIKAKTCD